MGTKISDMTEDTTFPADAYVPVISDTLGASGNYKQLLTGRINLLTGTTLAAGNLGAFTGTTIADNSSVKTALQALETAVEVFPSSAGSASVGFLQSGTGAVARDMEDKTREVQVSVFDFLTDAERTDVSSYTGALNVTTNFQKALDAAYASNRNLYAPPGVYNVTGLTLPGNAAGRTKAFKFYGQGCGELFARGFTGGTIIKSSTDAPILLADQDVAFAGNGNQEVCYIRFEQTLSTATAAVVEFETLYAQSEFHHCGIFQAGVGEGLRIRHMNTCDVHHNYILNRDWVGTTPFGSMVGTGLSVTMTNDNGLQTFRKNTVRGFLQGAILGSVTPGQDGKLLGWRMEQCEFSYCGNGIYISPSARDGTIDSCYFEGGVGGYGIFNDGDGNSVLNTHFSSGYSVCIDDTSLTNYGGVYENNSIGFGSVTTAAANPIGIRLATTNLLKSANRNLFIVNHTTGGGVPNCIGIKVSGANARVELNGNTFNPDNWEIVSGSKKIDMSGVTGVGAIGSGIVERDGIEFPLAMRSAISLYEVELDAADTTGSTLNLPAGSAFAFSLGVNTNINSINKPDAAPGSIVVLRLVNTAPTLINGATLFLKGGRSINGINAHVFLYCYEYIGTKYWVELSRYVENSIGGAVTVAPIADIGAAPTQADFNGLLASLRTAGVLRT